MTIRSPVGQCRKTYPDESFAVLTSASDDPVRANRAQTVVRITVGSSLGFGAVGVRACSAVGGLVLGSVGVQCLRRAHCPVLVVPHRVAEDAG